VGAVTAELRLRDVGMDFPTRKGRVRVLDGVDFTVSPGEFVCLVGASGSGKSTILSLVAGLQRPTAGQILLDGSEVTGPGSDRGLVFQASSLYPWRSVERNVGFALELLPISRRERARRVDWYLAEMGLTHLRKSLPKALSGGQQQRVAIARALACEPEVLLLDEPFGALDVQIKEDMQVFLRQVWQDTGTSVVMVTHDVEEAVFLGQRVLVLSSDPGHITEEVLVDLPADRDLDVKRTARFAEMRAGVEDLVRAQHRRHLAREKA
jgi:NitT/TauT family transport system ATP-binding protein